MMMEEGRSFHPEEQSENKFKLDAHKRHHEEMMQMDHSVSPDDGGDASMQ